MTERPLETLRPLGRRLLRSSTLPLLILTAEVLSTRSAQIDDAYISYRYAANLTAGKGLVFNTGHRVEGMSNLLWTLLLACLHELAIPLPLAGQLLGVASLAATVILTRRVAARYGMPPPAATATAAGVALTADLVASATVGLEGGLYAALLLGTILLWDRPGRYWLAFALLVSALGATRPEGMVLGAALAGTVLLLSGPPLQDRLRASVGALVGIAALEFERYNYYGELVPMSVTAKRDIGSSILTSLQRHSGAGSRYLYGLMRWPAFVLIGLAVLMVPGVIAYVRSGRAHRLPAALLPMTVSLGCGLGLPLLSGGHWMPHWRLVTPYLPVLYLAVGLALVTVGSRGGMSAAVIAPLLLALSFPAFLPDHFPGNAYSASAEAYDDLGLALERTPLTGRVVASDVLGRMSYFGPDVSVSDMFGLTEPAVAKTRELGGRYGKSNLAYTMSLHPAVIVSNYWPKEADLLAVGVAAPAKSPYVAVTSARLSSLRVFVLVEGPLSPALADALHIFDPLAASLPADQAFALWRHDFPRGF